METISGAAIRALRRNAKQNEFKPAPANGESKSERVERLYKSPGGPLMGLLYDEAWKRDEPVAELAAAYFSDGGHLFQRDRGQRFSVITDG